MVKLPPCTNLNPLADLDLFQAHSPPIAAIIVLPDHVILLGLWIQIQQNDVRYCRFEAHFASLPKFRSEPHVCITLCIVLDVRYIKKPSRLKKTGVNNI